MAEQRLTISLEGIDGSGKTTVFERLEKEFGPSIKNNYYLDEKAIPINFVRFPENEDIKKIIRKYKKIVEKTDYFEEEHLYASNLIALLFIADQIHKNWIFYRSKDMGREYDYKKDILITDRGAISTLAYQDYSYSLNVSGIREMVFNNFLVPKVIIYFLVDPTTGIKRCIKRKGGGKIQGKSVKLLGTVSRNYDNILSWVSKGHPSPAGPMKSRVHYVDGDQSKEKVYAQVKNIVVKEIREFKKDKKGGRK